MKDNYLIAEFHNPKKGFQVEVWSNKDSVKIARQDFITKEIFTKEFRTYKQANHFLINNGYEIFRYIYHGRCIDENIK